MSENARKYLSNEAEIQSVTICRNYNLKLID